jgi:hypothetical protein
MTAHRVGNTCLAIIFVAVSAGLARANVVVSPSTPNGWSIFTTDASGTPNTGTGTANFVNGPATPPLGTGSAHFATPAGGGDQSGQLRNTSWAGTKVSDLTALSYSTYAAAFNGSQLPFLNLYLDLNGDGVRDDRLWFEPTYSSAGAGNGNAFPQPNVQANTWQTWNALGGMWYSDNQAGPGSNAITLAAYLAIPGDANATIIDASPGVGGIRIASGFASPSDNFDTNVDNFSIGTAALGTTTYDFELSAVPEAGAFWLGAVICSVVGLAYGTRAAWRCKQAAAVATT